jgi:hypothetical protein
MSTVMPMNAWHTRTRTFMMSIIGMLIALLGVARSRMSTLTRIAQCGTRTRIFQTSTTNIGTDTGSSRTHFDWSTTAASRA